MNMIFSLPRWLDNWLEQNTMRELGKDYIRKESFNLLDGSRQTFYVHKLKSELARYDLYGNLRINEKMLAQSDISEVVILHEVGHKKQGIMLTLATIICLILLVFYAAFPALAIILFSIIFFIGNALFPQYQFIFMIKILIFSIALSLSLNAIIMQFFEGYADIYSIKFAGKEKYVKTRQFVAAELMKMPTLDRVLHGLSHPNYRHVLFVYDLLVRKG